MKVKTNPNNENFLKRERKKKKLTQQQVSDFLKIHVSTYSNIETGKRSPGFALAIRIADFYGIDERKLLK